MIGKPRFAWYDSLVIAAALEGKCQTLYSEDFQYGRVIEGLRIENPSVNPLYENRTFTSGPFSRWMLSTKRTLPVR